ncbi:MAG: hypothetical protein JW843_05110 [Candidatus Aminicenantes bacterium]|nr:hypothetical protein [Candidatus Aminicenantes bacterium]
MKKIIVYGLGLCLLVFMVTSCSPKPEESLLKSYFNAVSMNDNQTMSSMAVDPLKIEADDWKIVQVSEERIAPATLREMNQQEIDLKKQFEASSGPALDAQDVLNAAKDTLTGARSGAARAAAQKKVDEAQAKYDEAYNANRALVKQYNDAKEAASKEEEKMAFSLGVKNLANIRELTGEIAEKDLEIEVTKDGQVKKYKIIMEKYTMKDEAAGLVHRGRWIISKFELL